MCFGSKSKLKKNPPPASVPVQRPQGFNAWLESNPYNQSPRAPYVLVSSVLVNLLIHFIATHFMSWNLANESKGNVRKIQYGDIGAVMDHRIIPGEVVIVDIQEGMVEVILVVEGVMEEEEEMVEDAGRFWRERVSLRSWNNIK